jgi:hypothetical protein
LLKIDLAKDLSGEDVKRLTGELQNEILSRFTQVNGYGVNYVKIGEIIPTFTPANNPTSSNDLIGKLKTAATKNGMTQETEPDLFKVFELLSREGQAKNVEELLYVPRILDIPPKSLDNVNVEENPDNVNVEKSPGSVNVEENPDNVNVEENPDNVNVEENPDNVNVEKSPGSVNVEENPDNVNVEKSPGSVNVEESPTEALPIQVEVEMKGHQNAAQQLPEPEPVVAKPPQAKKQAPTRLAPKRPEDPTIVITPQSVSRPVARRPVLPAPIKTAPRRVPIQIPVVVPTAPVAATPTKLPETQQVKSVPQTGPQTEMAEKLTTLRRQIKPREIKTMNLKNDKVKEGGAPAEFEWQIKAAEMKAKREKAGNKDAAPLGQKKDNNEPRR